MSKFKYLRINSKSRIASKNMKPFLAEVLARTKDGDRINVLMRCNKDREDCVSLHSPFIFPTDPKSRDEILLSGGELSHPS